MLASKNKGFAMCNLIYPNLFRTFQKEHSTSLILFFAHTIFSINFFVCENIIY